MRAAKHDPAFRHKMGIPYSVAAEFVAADKKRNKFGYGTSKKTRKRRTS